MKVPVPTTPKEWVDEIGRAFLDAAETIPFSSAMGQAIGFDDLFHLAPAVALKFRGLRPTKKNLKTATDAALSSYVANLESQPVLQDPILSFAFCYLAAHFGLDLISDELVESLMPWLFACRQDIQRIVDEELEMSGLPFGNSGSVPKRRFPHRSKRPAPKRKR